MSVTVAPAHHPPAPSQQHSVSLVPQPAGEEFLIAHKPDDPRKEDLDDTPRDVRAGLVARTRVAAARLEPDVLLEGALAREMLVGGPVALELFGAWVANRRARTERRFAGLDAAMANTPGFTSMARRFEARVHANLREQYHQGNVDYHDLVTGPGPRRSDFDSAPATEPGRATGRMLPSIAPPLVDLSLIHDRVCKICIGSIQGIRVWVKNFRATASPPRYTGRLKYEIRDHFGVDDEDCEIAGQGFHGTPGQVAMWVLQHHRPPGHRPWITIAHVERDIQGPLA